MPVLFHVLFHVLALGYSKPTEGECIRPHIIMVARGGRRSDDPNFVLRVLPQVCDFSDSDMPDSEAATVPLVFPGETPGQRLGAPTRKTTAFLVSKDLYVPVRDRFAPLVCNHRHAANDARLAVSLSSYRT